jgi:transmembrane sensor
MNSKSENTALAGNADEVENTASAWLERREREDWSEDDRLELDGWLSQSPIHAVTFLRIEDVWIRADRLRALGASTQRDAPPSTNKSGWSVLSRIAISLILLVAIVSVATAYFSIDRYQTYVTTVGGHEKLSLSDGSSVELNTDTVLRVVDSNGRRMAWLDQGEAYFDIRHSKTNPFVVLVAGHRVTDVGTKFVVRTDPNRLEVRLMEGRAQFESFDAGDRKAELLNPGDVIIAQSGKIMHVRQPLRDMANELGWRRGMLIFHHTTLADAVAEFNRYSRQTIVVADADAARSTIDGALPIGDLQEFTRMARNFFELRPVKRGDTTVFVR